MTQFIWVGGRPSLDLCNTLTPNRDLLAEPEDVCVWLAEAGFERPLNPCQRDLDHLTALRMTLRAALLKHDPAGVAQIVSEWLRSVPGHLAVDRTSLETHFCPDVNTCECVLVPALLDAIDLARAGIDRVRECAAESCTMIYHDSSRNGSRRWCSMDRCGARAKAHTYYERRRGQSR